MSEKREICIHACHDEFGLYCLGRSYTEKERVPCDFTGCDQDKCPWWSLFDHFMARVDELERVEKGL